MKLESRNAPWVADGYRYGLGFRPSPPSTSQRRTNSRAALAPDQPLAAFEGPTVKLGSTSELVRGAVDPHEASWRESQKAKRPEAFKGLQQKLLDELRQPLHGDKIDDVTKDKKTTRPQSAPLTSHKVFTSMTSLRVSSPMATARDFPQRPMSAQPYATVVKPPLAQRPFSATSRPQMFVTSSARRTHSARPGSSQFGSARSAADLRKSFTMTSRSEGVTSPVPCCHEPRFLDRHARCFDNAHIHTHLRRGWPAPACSTCRTPTPAKDVALQLDRQDREEIENEGRVFFKRYNDALRPKTAPSPAASPVGGSRSVSKV